MLKCYSSVNVSGISNIISAAQNTVTTAVTCDKAESVAQCNSTQLDNGKHTPDDKSVLLLNILLLPLSLCNLVIWNRVLK
jgi:hypothetical protein